MQNQRKLYIKDSPPAFICDGEVRATETNVRSPYSMRSTFDCISASDIVSDPYPSSLQITSSLFKDITVSFIEGGLITGRGIRKEGVIECLFVNVSREVGGEEKKERRRLITEDSIICTSKIMGVEDGIYGVIVSGIQEGNGGGYSFVSSNNTFSECYRTQLKYHEVEMNEVYSNENYTS